MAHRAKIDEGDLQVEGEETGGEHSTGDERERMESEAYVTREPPGRGIESAKGERDEQGEHDALAVTHEEQREGAHRSEKDGVAEEVLVRKTRELECRKFRKVTPCVLAVAVEEEGCEASERNIEPKKGDHQEGKGMPRRGERGCLDGRTRVGPQRPAAQNAGHPDASNNKNDGKEDGHSRGRRRVDAVEVLWGVGLCDQSRLGFKVEFAIGLGNLAWRRRDFHARMVRTVSCILSHSYPHVRRIDSLGTLLSIRVMIVRCDLSQNGVMFRRLGKREVRPIDADDSDEHVLECWLLGNAGAFEPFFK